jgi:hypothetical protein
VLLVMVIVGLAVGWWLDRSQLATTAKQSRIWEFRANVLSGRIRDSGGLVDWDHGSILISDPRSTWALKGP